MPTTKGHQRGQEEKNRKGRLAERASSFHGRSPGSMGEKLLRPRTVPDLLSGKSTAGAWPDAPPKLTKLLLNVTIQRVLGPVQVVMSPESTVGDLIAAALRQYAKEARRSILPSTDPFSFDVHYSQFSLESLGREEKLMSLGSRNFFLCPKKVATEGGDGGSGCGAAESAQSQSSSCSKQADKANKIVVLPWLKFMDFLP